MNAHGARLSARGGWSRRLQPEGRGGGAEHGCGLQHADSRQVTPDRQDVAGRPAACPFAGGCELLVGPVGLERRAFTWRGTKREVDPQATLLGWGPQLFLWLLMKRWISDGRSLQSSSTRLTPAPALGGFVPCPSLGRERRPLPPPSLRVTGVARGWPARPLQVSGMPVPHSRARTWLFLCYHRTPRWLMGGGGAHSPQQEAGQVRVHPARPGVQEIPPSP